MSHVAPDRRLFFIDNLRTALVILVVLHHLALVYGAAAPFYYQEPPFDDPLAFRLLAVFVLLNQAWFMGALFLLAGYFTPGAVDRRGPVAFLKGRLLRLGVPIVAAILVLEPISRLGFFLMPASLTGISGPPNWSAFPQLLGLGPLWFVALLLIFGAGYAAWRSWLRREPPTRNAPAPFPSYLWLVAFVLLLAAVSYAMRLVVPLGKEVSLVVGFLNFPTIAYLPQYLSFFVVGIVAYRRGWLQTLPSGAGGVGAGAAVLATVILFPLALSGDWFSCEIAEPANFVGNGHWQSAVYALWDSITAVGLSCALLVLFRRLLNKGGAVARFLSRHSYAVYIIHSPIIVYLAFAVRGIELAALAKFALAAVVVLPVCFATAFVVRRLPGASKVL